MVGAGPPESNSRNQRPLLRYFPELSDALRQLPPGTVVDGEIVVVVGGATDFDTLQQRIHPAESRINRLSEETPAELVASLTCSPIAGQTFAKHHSPNDVSGLSSWHPGWSCAWHLTPQTPEQQVAQEVVPRLRAGRL